MIPMDNFNKRLMNLNLYKNFRLSDPFGIIPHPTCQESGHETLVLLQRDGSSVHKAKLKLPKNALPTKHLLEAMRISVCHAQMRKCANAAVMDVKSLKKKTAPGAGSIFRKPVSDIIFLGGSCRVWYEGVEGFHHNRSEIISFKFFESQTLPKICGASIELPPYFLQHNLTLAKTSSREGVDVSPWFFLHL